MPLPRLHKRAAPERPLPLHRIIKLPSSLKLSLSKSSLCVFFCRTPAARMISACRLPSFRWDSRFASPHPPPFTLKQHFSFSWNTLSFAEPQLPSYGGRSDRLLTASKTFKPSLQILFVVVVKADVDAGGKSMEPKLMSRQN